MAEVAGPSGAQVFPPINYIYTHLHDSIRSELDTLASAVLDLQQAGTASSGTGLSEGLRALRERYRFLEQVYKYHSSVEDEVNAAAWRRASRASAATGAQLRCCLPTIVGCVGLVAAGSPFRRHCSEHDPRPSRLRPALPCSAPLRRWCTQRSTPRCETSRWPTVLSMKMRSTCLSSFSSCWHGRWRSPRGATSWPSCACWRARCAVWAQACVGLVLLVLVGWAALNDLCHSQPARPPCLPGMLCYALLCAALPCLELSPDPL